MTNAIVLPISGWLASTIGRKRYFIACIIGFSITSLFCGTAPSLAVLIIARGLQGMTGGGLQPNAQAILTDTFPPARRGMAFAAYGIAVVFAPAIGPTLGGWITDNFTWRWVFLLNVPVGIMLSLLAGRVLTDPPELVAQHNKRLRAGLHLDYVGFALLVLGIGALQIMLDKGQEDDWFASAFISRLFIISVVSLVGFVIWELRRADRRSAAARRPQLRGGQLADVCIGVCPIGQHGAAAALCAKPAGLYRHRCRDGNFARRVRADADDAGGRRAKRQDRRTLADRNRLYRMRAGAVPDDPLRCRHRLCDGRLGAGLPVGAAGAAVHSDQHGCLLRRCRQQRATMPRPSSK